ncbi:MAG: hypothetical protein H6509_04920 [Bryobacterales bacterium]|nr:hypothetical protein [Acidobacteriota bacterium]MCB9383936.1 hypothetical protein [Bryobacterales bacterium]
MHHVENGQCGLCTHFGEAHPVTQQLTQIRKLREAPDDLVEGCGLPKLANLHLKVTPFAGCDGFEAARVN